MIITSMIHLEYMYCCLLKNDLCPNLPNPKIMHVYIHLCKVGQLRNTVEIFNLFFFNLENNNFVFSFMKYFLKKLIEKAYCIHICHVRKFISDLCNVYAQFSNQISLIKCMVCLCIYRLFTLFISINFRKKCFCLVLYSIKELNKLGGVVEWLNLLHP